MALTDHSQLEVRDDTLNSTVSMVVLNAAVIFNQALCSHDTTSGEIKPFDGTQTDRLAGWNFGDDANAANPTGGGITGNSAAPRNRASIRRGGFAFKNLAVATLANDATDFGKPVFATDDNTYTITDPTAGQKIGYVVADDDRATGQATVQFIDDVRTLVA